MPGERGARWQAHVTVFDINGAMLKEGERRAERMGYSGAPPIWPASTAASMLAACLTAGRSCGTQRAT